jgi:hypothetical protein
MDDFPKFLKNIRPRARSDRRQHPIDDPLLFPKNISPRSRSERRRHPRESCFIDSGYMVQNLWYRGCIRDIGAGGAYVQTSESSAFSPGEDVFLIARITVLRQQFRAKIAWVGLHGMGVKFQMLELDSGKSAHATDENESLEEERTGTSRFRNRKVRWEPSGSGDVVNYRLYWSTRGAVTYDSDFMDVGAMTEVTLPKDIPSFPLISRNIELAISAINEAGNESELIKAVVHADVTVPEAPQDPVIEEM